MAQLIMIVDDEPGVRALLNDTLRIAGFETVEATDGMSALTLLRTHKPDLLVIDINMPLMDGFELVERLRTNNDLTPVLMLTAREDKADITRGLKIGADDYVVKPFGIEELILRIKAILRRSTKNVDVPSLLSCGPISIDDDQHLVTFNGEGVDLSPTEYRLLQILIEKRAESLARTYCWTRSGESLLNLRALSLTPIFHICARNCTEMALKVLRLSAVWDFKSRSLNSLHEK